MNFDLSDCTLCPRHCHADRLKGRGYCGGDSEIRIARAAPHYWEEPCISGERGSGAIFFSGCSLGCLFCQNRAISHNGVGRAVTPGRLLEICHELAAKGVHNLSFVTADHLAPLILPVLEAVKREIDLPIVWNCGGYESPELIDALSDFVDVWLPDCKFFSPELAARYTAAPDYPSVALAAIRRMVDRAGNPRWEGGMLVGGVLARHLVLPGHRADSLRLIDRLAELFSPDELMISLMAQYTPNGVPGTPARRLTTFEYRSVADRLSGYRFRGYFQERSSAKEEYTPPFDLEGV